MGRAGAGTRVVPASWQKVHAWQAQGLALGAQDEARGQPPGQVSTTTKTENF